METQKIEIPWDDGSGESLTLNLQENDLQEVDITVSSPDSKAYRTKILNFRTLTEKSISLEIYQGVKVTNGIGSMEIGISFIIS